MAREAKHPVKTTRKTFDVVERLSELGSAGVTELATELEMSKSIVHNHLRTLEERGYVVARDGEYALGLRFFHLGGKTRKEMELYQTAKGVIDDTAAETGATTNLAVEENGNCVYLYRARGERSIDLQFSYEGMYEHMHQSAAGKAILAHLPEARIDRIIDRHGLPTRTEHTIDDRESLAEALDRIRERGYAVDDEESVLGLRCVAAPIRRDDETVLGSVSISGPKSQFKAERWTDELAEAVEDTANVIELHFAGRN